ncbi:hypothetical protein MAR_023446, partial [Mya arenaria]
MQRKPRKLLFIYPMSLCRYWICEVLLRQWRPVIIEDILVEAFQQYNRESSTPQDCETWRVRWKSGMWTSLSERRNQTDGQLTYWGLDPAALLPQSS